MIASLAEGHCLSSLGYHCREADTVTDKLAPQQGMDLGFVTCRIKPRPGQQASRAAMSLGQASRGCVSMLLPQCAARTYQHPHYISGLSGLQQLSTPHGLSGCDLSETTGQFSVDKHARAPES